MTVLIVGVLEQSLAEELLRSHDPLWLPFGAERDEFLSTNAEAVTAIVACGPPGVDVEVIDALPRLGAIINFGAGVDTIDLAAARRRGVLVSNTPDVLTDTVADTAIGLMLNTLRGFAAADRYVRAGRWASEGPFPYTRDLSGASVGILGLGRIGNAIATRLNGFDCAIAYHNRHQVPDSPYRYARSAAELAESVDVLVVATSGGAGSDHLVDREVLRALGPHGILINIARGNVVDQTALIELLATGRLAGAGLDVYEDEPHVPQKLRDLETVVLLPHMGSATARARRAMARLAVANLDEFLSSGRLLTPVTIPAQ
jgi:lactate dehydrogenase-like 2-hydroxyacid dehydrogenase